MKTIKVATFKTDPRDLTKNRGHGYGAGRKNRVMADKRTKRQKTRAAKNRAAMKGW